MEVRPNVGAALAACGATRLDVRKPQVILPLISHSRGGVAGFVVRAIDQGPSHACCAHFGEGDLLRAIQPA
jgi:hypothetical protein